LGSALPWSTSWSDTSSSSVIPKRKHRAHLGTPFRHLDALAVQGAGVPKIGRARLTVNQLPSRKRRACKAVEDVALLGEGKVTAQHG
jgi:hypothetical protein